MKKIIFILIAFLLYAGNSWGQNDIVLQKNSNCFSAEYFKSGEIAKSPGILTETKQYEIELFPGQEYTGYWYYWGSASIGIFSIAPKVDWLDINPDTIKIAGDIVQPVAFHFKSPKQTGVYETDVMNTVWSTVHVKLTVTNLPISTSTYNVAKLDDSLQYKTRLYYNRFTDIGTTGKYFPDSLCSFWWKGYPEMDNSSIQIKPNPIEIPIDSFRNFQTFFSGDIKDERIIQRISEWRSNPLCVRYKQKKVNPKECVVSFDQSTNQYIKTNYYPTAKPITVMYWVKFTQLLADQTIGSHDGNNHRVYLGLNSTNNIYAGLGSGYTSSISAGIILNKWVHLALVGDGKNALVYLNGKQVASFTYTFSGESSNDIYIGQRNYLSVPDSKLYGNIDDFQIWDKALTESEIKNYMNNCPYGNEVGLALYYPFREGEGNFTKDFSSNSYTGFIPNVLNWPIDVPNGNPKIKGIFKITPSMGLVGQDSITMEILGNKFNSQSKAYLIKADGSKYVPNKTIFKDSLHLTLKFDFSRMNVGEYSLVVVNEANDTLKQENCFKLLNQELIPYGEWVQFQVNHGTVYASGVNVPSTENLFVFVKKSSRTGYASTWKGKLRLLQDNEVISQQTDDENYGVNIIGGSYSDFALQVPNAPSGLYTFEIDNLKEDIQGEGEILFANTPSQLIMNQWDKGTILRAYGSDWKMVIVPENVDVLTIQTEGMGLWSTINVYYEDINQTANHWQFSNMGNGYTIKGIIKKPKSGVYFIKYMDSAVLQKDGSDNLYNHADNQSRDYMIYAGTTSTIPTITQPLSIEKLSTYAVGQGVASIDISGTGFSDSDTIKLINKNSVYTADVSFTDSRNTTATFDLAAADTGEYELHVINAKNEKTVSSSKVTVENASGNSGLWTQIIGRDKVRVGRKQKYIIRYGNNSNVDIERAALAIVIPSKFVDSIYVEKFIIDPTVGKNSIVKKDTTFFYIPHVSANSYNDFEFQISTTTDVDKVLDIKIYIFPLIEKSTSTNKILSSKSKAPSSSSVDICSVSHFKSASFLSSMNASQNEGLRDGDIVYMKFAPANEAIHAGIYLENVDPYSTGKTGNYVIEIANEIKPEINGIPFLSGGIMKATSWDGWGKIAGVDCYAGNARPIDDNNTKKSQLISEIKTNINKEFEAHNNNEFKKYDYDITSRIENNDLNRGHCGDLVNDLYGQVGVDVPGFNNWPYEQILEYQKQGKFNAMPGYENFKHDLGNLAKARFMELANLKKLGDNFIKFMADFVNSTTPEDKYGPVGASVSTSDSTAIHYIDTSKVFEYRVDYWNKEDATAPAANVYIRDTLDADFNLKTLNFTEVGFLKWRVKLDGGQYFNVNVDCRPDMPYIVNIEGTVDPETREVYWVHRTLDTLTMVTPDDPLSGYLPPIDTTGYQIGWVSYTIKANSNLPDGTVFTNQAHVNFDGVGKWGPAPKEGPYTNIFDLTAPTSSVDELPVKTNADSIFVTWHGKDTGCGLISYTVYVSTNGSIHSPWLTTTRSGAWFKGQYGNTYSFYSIATDGVGNIEVAKTNAEATTYMIELLTSVHISQKWNDVLICDNSEENFTSYQWYKNGVQLSGETKQFYYEPGGLNGSYYVEVVTIDNKTGISNVIETNSLSNSISIYPNPIGKGKIFMVDINADEKELAKGSVTVTTINGVVVKRLTELKPQVTLGGLESGVYIIQVVLSNGEALNKKLVVN